MNPTIAIITTPGEHCFEAYGPFPSSDAAHEWIDFNDAWTSDHEWLVTEVIEAKLTPLGPDRGCDGFTEDEWDEILCDCELCIDDRECAEHDDWTMCEDCNLVRRIDESRSGTSRGFTGAPIYWLAFHGCNHQWTDLSRDNLEAAR